MIKERIIQVAVIALVFLVLLGLFLPKPDDYKINQRRFWAYKTHSAQTYDIIIIGDSRAYRGISPAEMEKVLTGKKILNFGYSSGRLNDFMFKQTEKRLDENSRQKIIVMAVSPNALTDNPNENGHINSQLFLPKEEIYQRIYFAPFLKFFAPVQPKDLFETGKTKNRNYIEVFHDDGWVESYKIHEDTTEAISSYRAWFEQAQVSEKKINNLIEQTRKWQRNGIMVFAYRPPSSYSMEMLENELSRFDEPEFVKRFSNAGGIWISASSGDYHSYDGSHLHKDSALKLSKYIAEQIKHYLGEDKED